MRYKCVYIADCVQTPGIITLTLPPARSASSPPNVRLYDTYKTAHAQARTATVQSAVSASRLTFRTAPRPYAPIPTLRRGVQHGAWMSLQLGTAPTREDQACIISVRCRVLLCHALQRHGCDNGLCVTERNTVRDTAAQCGYGDAVGNRGHEGKRCKIWVLMMHWAAAATAEEKRAFRSGCVGAVRYQLHRAMDTRGSY